VLGPVGLTGDEFAIYSILDASPGITPSELSRWMAAPPTSVSSYVKRLQARGHLTRRPHPNDRRSYRIQLTAAGKRTHRSAVALFGPVRAQIIQALGDQHGPVRESLLRLRGVVDTVRGEPAEHGGFVTAAARSSAAPKPANESRPGIASDQQCLIQPTSNPDTRVAATVQIRERSPVPLSGHAPAGSHRGAS